MAYCLECNHQMPSTATSCPKCGHDFPRAERSFDIPRIRLLMG